VIAGLALAALVTAMAYGLLPRLAGIDDAWSRVRAGDPLWLLAALGFEALSFAGYVLLFRAVLGDGWFGWRVSLLITFAGVALTRMFAAGGAGGIALTAWALRRAGRDRRRVAVDLWSFLVVLYAVFMAALVLAGVGLATGVLAGPAPTALTIPPAVFGASVIATALLLAASRSRRPVIGAVAAGTRRAMVLVRGRDPRLLGAAGWWAFDVAVLWACLEAFGDAPRAGVTVMAYFVGMLGNLLPLPGGVGGVDGAMIGALIAFGVAAGLAVAGVLAYRVFAFWLPTVAGIPACAALFREARHWEPGDGTAAARRSAAA
jgi:uncharacterized membrane protein YbhN (UPF0104 family)